ncbi:MAG: restriction endonuclease subunit S [Verrucomicrobiae bacterium]|nr:restriction endonuclease subunit S [Verrucomicrobiae bacterium]
MTSQELRNSILQLAIQGKLVEQRPEEGSGEELYQEIQAEKRRLIKAGKIKRGKSLPEITEDDIPFDIPENWKWVRLRTLVYSRGQEVPSSLFSYIDIGSIDNENQRLNAGEYIIQANKAPSRARKIVELGDILYSTVRPYLHNMCIIDRQFSCKPIASTGFAAMTCHNGVYNKYLFYYLMSPSFDNYANHTENAKGVAYPAINDSRLYRAVVPLPPLAEQKRIVARIEELLPYIDRYEQAWSKLEEFNKRFPDDMQKSLLQYAIQGKLVEQRPEEGTGEKLYQEIQAEKRRLIKAGKIKREKPLPEITENEIPFDIPENWKWVRVGNITSLNPKNILDDNINVAFIPMPCVADGFRNQHTFEVRKWQKIKKGFTHFSNGDIGIAKITPCFQNRKSVIFKELENGCGAGSTELSIVRAIKNTLVREYLLWFFKTNYFIVNGVKSFAGTAGQQRIHKDFLKTCLIPLPPLAEQKRIVAKLEELLPLCEKLKK